MFLFHSYVYFSLFFPSLFPFFFSLLLCVSFSLILVSFLFCYLTSFLSCLLLCPRRLPFSPGSLSFYLVAGIMTRGICVSYATAPVPFALSHIWYLRRGSRVSPGFSHPRSLLFLRSFPSLQLRLALALCISRYYYIPTARISEMKSTLLLTLPSTVSSVLLLSLPPPRPPFPPPAAAKSLAGLLRRQKFNIAVTLRWLYVLTVSSLCSDNVLLSKSDSAKRRLSGRVDSSSWRIHESGE